MTYLHEDADGVFHLDHRLTPEVRAMLCAMASRMPLGGIRARYDEIVLAVAEGIWDEVTTDKTWKEATSEENVDTFLPQIRHMKRRAEDRLTTYPLHERVQVFFDKFVKMYGHCYDDQTEVLCQDAGSGQIMWMHWKDAVQWQGSTDADGGDEVRLRLAAFDPTTDSVRFEEPSAWIAKPYKGRMYKVKKERGNVDLLVTPEHTMLVRKREYVGSGQGDATYEWSDWRGVKAEEVAGKTCYRYKRGAARMAETRDLTENEDPWGLSLINPHAFGRLCGFFVGDGYAGGRQAGYLSFNIRKEREQAFLAGIETDLGLKVQRDKSGRCHVHLEGARDWARTFFYHPTATVPSGKPAKNIPSWVYTAPEAFVRGFLEGLHNSDGSKVTEDSWSFANSSDPVTEGLQILGSLWGCPVSIRGPYQKGGSKIAFVSGPKCREPVVNRGRDRHEDGWDEYDGMVYCATVSTGFLIVRRNHATMVSGNSSIMELTGSPSVYVEGISWWTAYLLFDNPLVSGQEFSTRAVRHKDWPMARACYIRPWTQDALNEFTANTRYGNATFPDEPHPDLLALHYDWFEVFEAEVDWWRDYLSVAANREALGIADKEPFRPALDRARWAIPGTIATGCAHTGNLRVMARVLQVGSLLAQRGKAEMPIKTWEAITEGYRKAVPGLAEMGLREAVYGESTRLPAHVFIKDVPSDREVRLRILPSNYRPDLDPLIKPRPEGERSYLDPSLNQHLPVEVTFQCSLAVARDWHRHRTMYPWTLDLVRDHKVPDVDEGAAVGAIMAPIQLHSAYEPKSALAKKKVPALLQRSSEVYDTLMAEDNQMQAVLALPLGTRVQMRGVGGLRDVVYMLELRGHAHGANFEYKAQALAAMDQLRDQLEVTLRRDGERYRLSDLVGI